MGDNSQSNQQQANAGGGWQQSYPLPGQGYYNVGYQPYQQQQYMQPYPMYQMQSQAPPSTYYAYPYGQMPMQQGQWMTNNWNTTGAGGEMPPSSSASNGAPPPLPTLPPPPPPPPPPPSSSASSYEPPAPGSGLIRFSIPNKNSMLNKPPAHANSQQQVEKKLIPSNIPVPHYQAPPSTPNKNQPAAAPAAASSTSTSPNNNKGQLMNSVDWPDSLRRYVERCFAMCETSVDKDLVEIILKGKLTSASRAGTAHNKDWDNEPLPNLASKKDGKSPNNGGSPNKIFPPSSPVVASPRVGGMLAGIRPLKSPFLPRNLSSSESPRAGKNENSSFRMSGPNNVAQQPISFQLRGGLKKNLQSRSRSRSPLTRSTTSRSSSTSSSRSASSRSRSPSPVFTKKLSRAQLKKLNKKQKMNQNLKKSNVGKWGGNGDNKQQWASPERLRKRQDRFHQTPGKKMKMSSSSLYDSSLFFREDTNGEQDWGDMLVVGECMEIEKPFFRLTAAPDPSTVRPLAVLRKALAKVKSAWISNADYRWCCDQTKSIRQDLTVQGIRDAFTVEVYETHARLALEARDHEEFNQCQTQLKSLHHDLGGKNCLEFTAYRILYYVFTKSTLDLTTTMASLSSSDKADECVAHALEVRSSWALGNFRRFFRLLNSAPRMSAYLMAWFADRERKVALKTLIKAYRPTIPVDLVMTQLGFPSIDAWQEFSKELPIVYTDDGKAQIDCKASAPILSSIL